MPSLGQLLTQWERVAVYFLLRLTIAPCVESLMLLDRTAYLHEQGEKQKQFRSSLVIILLQTHYTHHTHRV